MAHIKNKLEIQAKCQKTLQTEAQYRVMKTTYITKRIIQEYQLEKITQHWKPTDRWKLCDFILAADFLLKYLNEQK